MKIFLVLEDNVYHDAFIRDLIWYGEDEIVGIGMVKKSPQKGDDQKYMVKSMFKMTPMEIFKLGHKFILSKWFDSLSTTFDIFGINYFYVENVNDREIIKKIKKLKPDVIVNSSPLIFKEEILKVPKICCINRHCALLPSYGGLLPVFHAMKNKEKYTGVSVHIMEKEIDSGTVIAQTKVKIKKGMTLDELYKECFSLSAQVVFDALKKIKKKDFSRVGNYKKSYYHFPTDDDWIKFRKAGGRII